MPASLTIHPVSTKRDLKTFIQVPRQTFGGDPAWVPPFTFELTERLSPKKNPYFQHAHMQAWIALRDGKPVGRISAQVDRLSLEHNADKTGHFGFFDVMEGDDEAASALFGTAEGWLKDQGMNRVLGPYNPTINEEPGILVDGFEDPPMMLMGHSRPWYRDLVEANGYAGVRDLYAYHLDIRNEILPPQLKRMTDRVQDSGKLTLRQVRMDHYQEDLDIILGIFNDAWSDNWGFLPMTDEELKHTADGLKLLIQPDISMIAEHEGRPIAMMVTLPNLNEIMQKIDGKLLPLGWTRLLWWLKVGPARTVRVPLMGVLKEFQNGALGAAASLSLIEAIRQNTVKKGGCFAELSWILDDNLRMQGILEKIGCRLYKTYRVYGKDLT